MTQRKLTFTLLIPLTLALSSCGNNMDLTTAKSLAKTGNDADAAFQNIANDAYDSCLRQARYTPLQERKEGLIDQKRTEAESLCDNETKKTRDALKTANDVVVKYLQALGQLAADDLTTYDSQLNSLGASLSQLKLSQSEVSAGTTIASFLFKITTEHYRRKQLKSVVTDTDGSLNTYIQGVSTAITKGYINGILEDEKAQVGIYFNKYLREIISSKSTQNLQGTSLTLTNQEIVNLDGQWESAKKAISDRQQLAQQYVTFLQNIATDHHKLTESYRSGKMLSTTQLHHITESYAKDLNLITEKSNKLFKKTTLR